MGDPVESFEGNLAYRTHVPAQSRPGGALLVLLHGWGSDETDWDEVLPLFDPRFRIAAVRAPLAHPPGWAWYPRIAAWDGSLTNDDSVAASARHQLASTVAECVAVLDTDPDRTFLVGFSQGAAMALYATTTVPGLCAGAVVLSGRLVNGIEFETNVAMDGLPVFVAHGLHDTVEPVEQGRAVRKFLEIHRASATYREYPVGHEVTPEIWDDLLPWLALRADEADWNRKSRVNPAD